MTKQNESTVCNVCGCVVEPVYELLVPYVRTLSKGKPLSSMIPRQGAQVGWQCNCDRHMLPESVIEENRTQLESMPRCHDDFSWRKR